MNEIASDQNAQHPSSPCPDLDSKQGSAQPSPCRYALSPSPSLSLRPPETKARLSVMRLLASLSTTSHCPRPSKESRLTPGCHVGETAQGGVWTLNFLWQGHSKGCSILLWICRAEKGVEMSSCWLRWEAQSSWACALSSWKAGGREQTNIYQNYSYKDQRKIINYIHKSAFHTPYNDKPHPAPSISKQTRSHVTPQQRRANPPSQF